jgi:site-specific DNA-methyltransferase (adenine-specific)
MKQEYYKSKFGVLYCGDCLEVMKEMPDNSVDTIITDPPYGLKFMGKKWDYDVPSIESWRECLRVLKPGGTALIFAGSRTQHRMACNVEDAGFVLKDCIMWLYGSGFPKAFDIAKGIDQINGAERKVIGKDKNWGKKGTVPLSGYKEFDITAPATPEAKLWNGWKSHGLKPAYEPILVCMKPNEGSYAENALKYGVAGLNIDGGRIGEDILPAQKRGKAVNTNFMSGGETPEHKGRFPANIILDEESAEMLDKQSGESVSSGGTSIASKNYKSDGHTIPGGCQATGGFKDSGGASRFFYVAKASKEERNAGCEGLELKLNRKSGAGLCADTIESNIHPTVKPISLMQYLCRLTKTPKGGTVLDPYTGSGSTLVACILEGREFIGIEREEEYCQIAKKRIQNQDPAVIPDRKSSLFDIE